MNYNSSDENLTGHDHMASNSNADKAQYSIGLAPLEDDDLVKTDDDITTTLPKEKFRLGYVSCACLIINRMIGTGIFTAPSRAMTGVHSPGITLLFWFAGGVAAMAGIYTWSELGLSTPRLRYPAGSVTKQGIPRSGGELNYLQYIYRDPWWGSKREHGVGHGEDRPRFLAACVYGVPFVIVGNMAANGLIFAESAYGAAGEENPSKSGIRGIALVVATFACIIHSVSRQGGIYLSNILAFVKVGILLLIILTGLIAASGVHFNGSVARAEPSNLSLATSFPARPVDIPPNVYARATASAFLSISFAYGGINQANYVLSEIKDPRRTFARAAPAAVALVTLLYMLTNIAFMLVVPMKDQIRNSPDDKASQTALVFFERTYGRLTNDDTAKRLLNGFMAVSSFGNIVVMTFTAARVKQELAKEGILPFPKFFASSIDLNWRRLCLRQQRTTDEETPVGALTLHWAFAVLLILATWPLDPTSAYDLLSNVYALLLIAIFPTLIGAGMLYLRLTPRLNWKAKSAVRSKWLSIASALVVAVSGLFPVIVQWIPPPTASSIATSTTTASPAPPWYTAVTTAWCILAFGFAYYLCFRFVAPRFGSRQGKRIRVYRQQHFSATHGYPVQEWEVVQIRWEHWDRGVDGAARGHGGDDDDDDNEHRWGEGREGSVSMRSI